MLVLIILVALIALGLWLWLGKQKPAPLSPAKHVPATKLRYENVLQEASFAQTPATAASGMQWSTSWSEPRDDNLEIVFDAEFDRGLLLGVGRGMTDTNGGYVVHLLSPDRASQQHCGDQERLVYGLSDLLKPSDIRTLGIVKASNVGWGRHTYWFRHGPVNCELGKGNRVGENVIFLAPHRCTEKQLRFIGFGTSCDSHQEERRRITRVGFTC